MNYILLIVALTLNASANVLMKIGASHSNKAAIANNFLEKIFILIKNPYLLFGILLFGLNIIFYFLALTKIKLSIAYPLMTAGGLLIISVVSVLLFKESISAIQIFGIILLVLGIILITSSIR